MARVMVYLALIIAVVAAASAASTATRNWCNVKSCKYPTEHTRCKFDLRHYGSLCNKVENAGLSSAEKNAILRKHNELRRKVASGQETRGAPGPQPASSDLGDLTWDDELAEVAQAWANQCNFNHDTCRNVDRFVVGQNIATKSTTGPNNIDLVDMVVDWYSEVDYVDGRSVSRMNTFQNQGEAIGHYTQLVWAKTKLVGCGAIRYNEPDGWNTSYLVCNYGQAGNYRGQALYKIRN